MRAEERYHDRVRVERESEDDARLAWLVMETGDRSSNCFTASMIDGMTEGVETVSGDIDALILYGEDEFSVGADLRSIRDTPLEMRPVTIDGIAAVSNRFIRAIRSLDAPVVAAVYGIAAGGGFGFALACDYIALHQDARLDPAYARIGLTPDNATSYFLAQVVGPYRARELFFAPEAISAEEARSLGLANVVYDGDREAFRKQVREYVTRFTRYPTSTHGATKTLVDTAFETDLDAHLERERDAIKRASESPAFDKGLSAFFERRRPK